MSSAIAAKFDGVSPVLVKRNDAPLSCGGEENGANPSCPGQLLSRWGVVFILLLVTMTQVRPQLITILRQYAPSFAEWVQKKTGVIMGLFGPTASEKKGGKKEQQVVLAKLVAMKARVYGSMHCSWTRRQLEIIGVDVTSELFIDCDKEGAKCQNIQAFPTWTIEGKTEPGYLPLDALGMIADGVLLSAYKDPRIHDVGDEGDVVNPSIEKVDSSLEDLLKDVEDDVPLVGKDGHKVHFVEPAIELLPLNDDDQQEVPFVKVAALEDGLADEEPELLNLLEVVSDVKPEDEGNEKNLEGAAGLQSDESKGGL
jgi:hypothetical protein